MPFVVVVVVVVVDDDDDDDDDDDVVVAGQGAPPPRRARVGVTPRSGEQTAPCVAAAPGAAAPSGQSGSHLPCSVRYFLPDSHIIGTLK